MNRTFLLFLSCNGFAAAVNFGTRLMFSLVMPYVSAVVCAYLIGMITAFVLSRAFVFQGGHGSVGGQVIRFVMINILAVFQTLVVSVSFACYFLPWFGWTWQSESVAHGIGVVVPAITSYFGHKYWSFRHV